MQAASSERYNVVNLKLSADIVRAYCAFPSLRFANFGENSTRNFSSADYRSAPPLTDDAIQFHFGRIQFLPTTVVVTLPKQVS